jgi:cytochrome c553
MNWFVLPHLAWSGLASRAAIALLVVCAPLAAARAADAVSTADTPPQVPDTIQQRVKACSTCHGVHGEGSPGDGVFPRLAGKPAAYLAQQLAYFQHGLRKYAPMEYTVRQLSPAYMEEIAAYFSAQEAPYHQSPVPSVSAAVMERGKQLVERGDSTRGIPSCVSCHGERLTGVEPAMPGLAGLSYDYVSAQIGSWRTHTRAAKSPDCMAIVANRLRDSDITAVAAWLGSLPPPTDMHAQPAGVEKQVLPGWCVASDAGVTP